MAAPHVRPHVLQTDLVIGECARWYDGRLWFAHWGAQEVRTVDHTGTSEVKLPVPTTVTFSIDWLPDGRLLVASGQEGRLLRQERGGSLVAHADLTGLSPYRWNDLVVDGRGNIYLNSICSDFLGGQDPVPGIIALVTPDGTVRQVMDGLDFPNGMVVTPDNATLIVAESFSSTLTAFTIAVDGSLAQRRVGADLERGGSPGPGGAAPAERGRDLCGGGAGTRHGLKTGHAARPPGPGRVRTLRRGGRASASQHTHGRPAIPGPTVRGASQ